MKFLDVEKSFKTQQSIADALGITQAAVSKWGEIIPEKQAMRLERITGGQLKYDPDLYSKSEKHLSASGE